MQFLFCLFSSVYVSQNTCVERARGAFPVGEGQVNRDFRAVFLSSYDFFDLAEYIIRGCV
ncbi:hypothetical protein MCHI_002734 [Candidatus Magnetoovum chiemensis]|nr:hypothetical protein MCHI_002734 [Candidatus Magnetoovum chiemensis]